MVFEKENMTSADEWTVNFKGGFWGDSYGENTKIPIYQSFQYCNETCQVPYIYICPEGVVVDYCVGAKTERLKAFLEKWNFRERSKYNEFTPEEIEAIEEEHPLKIHFNVDQIRINEIVLRRTHGCSICYMPKSCQLDNYKNQEDELKYIQRYGLDGKMGWVIYRISYPWDNVKTESIENLELHLTADTKKFDGIHISDAKAGDVLRFIHPVTGKEHQLTILEIEKQLLDGEHFQDDELEYPKHFYAMQYRIEPDIPMENVSVLDCAQGDSPKYKGSNGKICGAVGVAAITGIRKDHECRLACSSMHFEPAEHIEWRMTFREKMAEDADIKLI